MLTELKIVRANPTGNITLFVYGSVPESKYARVGAELMACPEFQAEQVGFITDPLYGSTGRIEMSGGEFCGNAARAFGYYLSKIHAVRTPHIDIEISGSSIPVHTTVYPGRHVAFAELPLPVSVSSIDLPAPYGTCPFIRFDGIWHILLIGHEISEDAFERIRGFIYSQNSPEALGVMFLSSDCTSMDPMVYVLGPNTTYRESSCGSGTAAVAAYLANTKHLSEISIRQPAGIMQARMTYDENELIGLMVGGSVYIDEPVSYTMDI